MYIYIYTCIYAHACSALLHFEELACVSEKRGFLGRAAEMKSLPFQQSSADAKTPTPQPTVPLKKDVSPIL